MIEGILESSLFRNITLRITQRKEVINDGNKARVRHNVGQILSGICLGKMIEKYQKNFCRSQENY